MGAGRGLHGGCKELDVEALFADPHVDGDDDRQRRFEGCEDDEDDGPLEEVEDDAHRRIDPGAHGARADDPPDDHPDDADDEAHEEERAEDRPPAPPHQPEGSTDGVHAPHVFQHEDRRGEPGGHVDPGDEAQRREAQQQADEHGEAGGSGRCEQHRHEDHEDDRHRDGDADEERDPQRAEELRQAAAQRSPPVDLLIQVRLADDPVQGGDGEGGHHPGDGEGQGERSEGRGQVDVRRRDRGRRTAERRAHRGGRRGGDGRHADDDLEDAGRHGDDQHGLGHGQEVPTPDLEGGVDALADAERAQHGRRRSPHGAHRPRPRRWTFLPSPCDGPNRRRSTRSALPIRASPVVQWASG